MIHYVYLGHFDHEGNFIRFDTIIGVRSVFQPVAALPHFSTLRH